MKEKSPLRRQLKKPLFRLEYIRTQGFRDERESFRERKTQPRQNPIFN